MNLRPKNLRDHSRQISTLALALMIVVAPACGDDAGEVTEAEERATTSTAGGDAGADSDQGRTDVTLTAADDGKAQSVTVGDVIAIQLVGQPSTGFDWKQRVAVDGDVLEELSREYGELSDSEGASASPPLAGRQQLLTIRFRAVGVGSTRIDLVVARFDGEAGEGAFAVPVTVTEASSSSGSGRSAYTRTETVEVEPGGETESLSARIGGGEKYAYSVAVRQAGTGEELNVDLRSLEGQASFIVLGPEGEQVSAGKTTVSVALEESGEYLVVVTASAPARYELGIGVSVLAG